ncbi:hypothetical protein, partial [Pontibacter rugosus]
TDVLTVTWPDIEHSNKSELEYLFHKLNDTIRYYDIKKLLIDSRFNKVQLAEEEYEILMKNLCEGLRNSRLDKTARVGSLDTKREPKAEKLAYSLAEKLTPSFAFQNFQDRKLALKWLQE